MRQGAVQDGAGQLTMSGGYLRAAEQTAAAARAAANDRPGLHGDEDASPAGSHTARAAARRLLAPLQGRRSGRAGVKGCEAGSVAATPDASRRSRSSSRPCSPLAAAESSTHGGSARGGSTNRSSTIASTPGGSGISSGGPHSPLASPDGGAHGARGVSSPAARAASPAPLSPDGSVRSGGSGASPSSPAAAAAALGPRAGGEAVASAAEAAPALPPAHAGGPPRPAAGVNNGSGRSLDGPHTPPKPEPARRDGGSFHSGGQSAIGSAAAAANTAVDGAAAAPAPANDRGGLATQHCERHSIRLPLLLLLLLGSRISGSDARGDENPLSRLELDNHNSRLSSSLGLPCSCRAEGRPAAADGAAAAAAAAAAWRQAAACGASPSVLLRYTFFQRKCHQMPSQNEMVEIARC